MPTILDQIIADEERAANRTGPEWALHDIEQESDAQHAELEVRGEDTRENVADTDVVPFRWICSLDLRFDDPDAPGTNEMRDRATGVLIGPSHVLTAAHALYRKVNGSKHKKSVNAGPREIWVRPGQNGPKTAPYGVAQAVHLSLLQDWKDGVDDDDTKWQFDYGLIHLERPIANEKFYAIGNQPMGFWGSKMAGRGSRIVPLINPDKLNGEIVNVAGYSGRKCDRLPAVGHATHAQMAACPLEARASTQWHSTGTCVRAKAPRMSEAMLYTNDTYGGMSGAPVWLRYDKVRWLVGIHSGFVRIPDKNGNIQTGNVLNRGVRITPQVWRNVLEWMKWTRFSSP